MVQTCNATRHPKSSEWSESASVQTSRVTGFSGPRCKRQCSLVRRRQHLASCSKNIIRQSASSRGETITDNNGATDYRPEGELNRKWLFCGLLRKGSLFSLLSEGPAQSPSGEKCFPYFEPQPRETGSNDEETGFVTRRLGLLAATNSW